MGFELLPQYHVCVFWSADLCYCPIYRKTVKNGEEKTILFLVLSPETMNRYGISEEDLNKDVSNEYGVLIREYPTSLVKNLSDSSDLPMLLVLCNFDGTLTINETIQKVANENASLRNESQTAWLENKRILGLLKSKIEEINELRRTS